MLHENEDKVMKAPGVCPDGSSCRRTLAPSVRVKKLLPRLHIQLLVVLLAGQASCYQTSTVAPPLSATTNAQTSAVYYFVTVDVNGQKNESEIKAWLIQVYQNNLDGCVFLNHSQTTVRPTVPQTTSASTYNTTLVTATTQSDNTTAATTALRINMTTAATLTPSETTSTVSNNSNATTAATLTPSERNIRNRVARAADLNGNNTTAATSTASNNSNATTAATSTASDNSNATTAVPSTASNNSNATTAATSTASNNSNATTAATSTTSNSNITIMTTTNQFTSVASTRNSSLTTSGLSNNQTTGIFQGLEVTCLETATNNTSCAVMLKLKRSIHPCCILRTLRCAANTTSSDIQVVGKKAERASHLLNVCNSSPQLENSCTYNGPPGAPCEGSWSAYVVHQSNSTHCGAARGNNSCSCSAYCSGTDAFYTFNFSIKDPTINISYIMSLINKLKQPATCSLSADAQCVSPIKDANVTCGSAAADLQSCRAVLSFALEVPICDVSAAVADVFESEEQITYNGLVTRAAICGNSALDNDLLTSPFIVTSINLKPANFCMTIEDANILTCQNGKNVVVLLEEQCFTGSYTTTTTPSPNVTTAQPHTTTTPSVNVTSPPTLSPNVTTTQPNSPDPSVNVTLPPTLSPNVTATQPNTADPAANITSSPANATAVTETLDTTGATTNGSVPVTPSQSPATTESAEGQANALLDLTRDVSKLNSSQVDQLVSQLESLLSGPTVSLALGNTSIHIVSNLLGASPDVLSSSSNRIIGIVDTVALKLVLDQLTETLLSPAVALSVKSADGSNFQETFFTISNPNTVQVRGDPRVRRSVRNDSIPQGSIKLPPSLTQDLTSEEQQLATRVQFNFYQKSTVFQDTSLGERKLNSGILGAKVANLSISGLQDDVVIRLKNTEPVPANFVSKCVFWDFTFNNGSGGWNPSGCFVRHSTDNETVCSCNHLTSFAILLDLSREPLTSRLQATILTFITYIGCGISAIFLSITLLTYLAFGKLRKDIPSKILIQLCLALLLLNLVFLVDAWLALYPDAVGLCISTAWFLHYFLLVTFTWMGLEAVHMYLALVKVFNSYISRYMLKFSLVGWGVPMIVVIIVIAIDKDNYGLVSYGKFTDGTSDGFCWLKNDIAFYVAVVAYFCVIFLFNFIMFIVVLVQLCRIKRQNPHNVLHRTTLQDARSVAGITILLGLTWGFAFFAWGPVNLPFMYLFSIFNSLQGFFIFVFHCAVKENVRRQWRTYLCCGRMRLAENSEWSRTATQKTAKKSSVTRLTSLHSSSSSQSNNFSSSSSFLVSESSEQISGIGSPFEDRTITADEEPSMDVVLNEINRQYRQAP